MFTHQYVYVGGVKPIDASLLGSKGDEVLCDEELHEAYRSVLGAVAWAVLTRAELATYVQALQRRPHGPRIQDCKQLSLVTRYMKKHKCGLKTVKLQHPFKLVGIYRCRIQSSTR